jgi:hypothetical protein
MGEQTMATKNQLVMQLDSNLTPLLRICCGTPSPLHSLLQAKSAKLSILGLQSQDDRGC